MHRGWKKYGQIVYKANMVNICRCATLRATCDMAYIDCINTTKKTVVFASGA